MCVCVCVCVCVELNTHINAPLPPSLPPSLPPHHLLQLHLAVPVEYSTPGVIAHTKIVPQATLPEGEQD